MGFCLFHRTFSFGSTLGQYVFDFSNGRYGWSPTAIFKYIGAAAWLMLFCNPAWLFDVGFQLSFLAVASILLIQKPIYHLITVKGRIGKYIWGLMSVSVAAQIGTAPLVMFYFPGSLYIFY